MNQEYKFDNIEKRIKNLQTEGWKILQIGKSRFEFIFSDENGSIDYSRPYDNLDDLVPLEWFAKEAPEIDVKAEYFSRLYQTYWIENTKKEIIKSDRTEILATSAISQFAFESNGY